MQGGSLKPNNLAFISVVMNTLVPGHNSDVPGGDKGTAARILIVMCTLPRVLHATYSASNPKGHPKVCNHGEGPY